MSFWPQSRKARRRLTILLAIAPVLALAVGLALYGRRLPASEGFDLSKWNPIQKAAGKHLYLDAALSGGSSKGVMGLASAFKVFDKGVIDGLIVEGPPKVVRAVGGLLTTLQSGFVRGYAALMQIGIIALVAYFAYVVSQRGGQ
jgi:NADH:ubiquinone oxidoreductase subunit 5 (subunit L)/multisubunit Na+/H+ antiporter MnhA subunit